MSSTIAMIRNYVMYISSLYAALTGISIKLIMVDINEIDEGLPRILINIPKILYCD